MNKLITTSKPTETRLLGAVKSSVNRRIHARQELSLDDERDLAAIFDLQHGLDLPRQERSKRAHDLSTGAPTLHVERVQDA